MIKTLSLRNFTVFEQADLEFSPGLNVIIGENGLGKTHILKLGYLFSNAWQHLVKNQGGIAEKKVEQYFSEHIRAIFKPDKVGSLTTNDSDGKSHLSSSFVGSIPTITVKMPDDPTIPPIVDEIEWSFSFSNRSIDNIKLQDRLTSNATYGKSVFLPSKEIVSFFEGFLALYEKREVSFDETYRDLALHLSSPKLKATPAIIQRSLADLSIDVGGTLKLEGGKFYLISTDGKRKEISLVAEGIRKLATLIHLIENGSLETGDTLFWDEPESNLNPKLIKDVAAALLFLCKNGIQVVIATHSLFLLRELEILSSQKEYQSVSQRYFSLEKTQEGAKVHQGGSVDDIDPLVMFYEDLQQSERFMSIGDE